MPAPAARLWLNFARLVNAGALPRNVSGFMIVAAALFAVMGALKALAARRAAARLSSRNTVQRVARWERLAPLLPNGIAFAVGLGLNTVRTLACVLICPATHSNDAAQLQHRPPRRRPARAALHLAQRQALGREAEQRRARRRLTAAARRAARAQRRLCAGRGLCVHRGAAAAGSGRAAPLVLGLPRRLRRWLLVMDL
jgi:hypothetical protein